MYINLKSLEILIFNLLLSSEFFVIIRWFSDRKQDGGQGKEV